MRGYKPGYLHFWQLKTYWHEAILTVDDIEMHSFKDMETDPAKGEGECSKEGRMVTGEMKR